MIMAHFQDGISWRVPSDDEKFALLLHLHTIDQPNSRQQEIEGVCRSDLVALLKQQASFYHSITVADVALEDSARACLSCSCDCIINRGLQNWGSHFSCSLSNVHAAVEVGLSHFQNLQANKRVAAAPHRPPLLSAKACHGIAWSPLLSC